METIKIALGDAKRWGGRCSSGEDIEFATWKGGRIELIKEIGK